MHPSGVAWHVAHQRRRRHSDQWKSWRRFLRREVKRCRSSCRKRNPSAPALRANWRRNWPRWPFAVKGEKPDCLVGTINGEPARQHFLARFLEESGFVNTAVGFQMRRIVPIAMPAMQTLWDDRDRCRRRRSRFRRARDRLMPEGDTIFRAARTLNRALAGQVVTGFETQLPKLARVDFDSGVDRTNRRKSGGARQVDADAFLRRPDPADAHADERQLAHLSAGRRVAATRDRHADRGEDGKDLGGGVSMCRSRNFIPQTRCGVARVQEPRAGCAGNKFRCRAIGSAACALTAIWKSAWRC